MEGTNIRNINLPDYDEEAALAALYKNADEALDHTNYLYDEHGLAALDQLTIIVNGIEHAFILGGPQTAAICKFIEQISDENLYRYPWE